MPIDPVTRRARTKVPGQYAFDLLADAAAIEILRELPVRIVSEESGLHERAGAGITVVEAIPVPDAATADRLIADLTPLW
jgi:hypothetical protein